MKKLLLSVLFAAGVASVSFAQTTPAKPTKPASKMEAVKKDPKTTPAPATTAKVVPMAKPANGATMKKDGTPDMRYKENKGAAKAAPAPVHVKKDGTADKRFKENKKN